MDPFHANDGIISCKSRYKRLMSMYGRIVFFLSFFIHFSINCNDNRNSDKKKNKTNEWMKLVSSTSHNINLSICIVYKKVRHKSKSLTNQNVLHRLQSNQSIAENICAHTSGIDQLNRNSILLNFREQHFHTCENLNAT